MAYTSGGVRSSWPSRNGSVAGSIGGGGSSSNPAPGRDARAAAMIDLYPVRGSTRTSGTEMAVDVGGQLGGRAVAARVDVLRAPGRVHEDRDGEVRGRLQRAGDVLVRVLVGGVRDGIPLQEVRGGGALVLRVQADEGHLAPARRGERLQDRELRAAGPA